MKILQTLPVQVMALLWDPSAAGEAPPPSARSAAWRFLYNFEVYHQRMLALLPRAGSVDSQEQQGESSMGSSARTSSLEDSELDHGN